MSAEMIFFFAFIVVYALLIVSHKECNPRAYKMFSFGLLISILYASVYSIYPNVYLFVILFLTSMAILTQYFHLRAVDAGRSEATKQIVDVTKPPHWEKGMPRAKRPAKSRSSRRRRR